MIPVTDTLSIDEREIHLDFVRASGPGGQNVNKVSSAVQLRFNVRESASLPPEVRARLVRLAGSRMTREGELLIDARRHRSQDRNREEAIARLVELIRRATITPRPRHKTRPTRASRERRLEHKHRRGKIKGMRGRAGTDEN